MKYLIFVLLLQFSIFPFPFEWGPCIIVDSTDEPVMGSIDVDSNNYPHIAYQLDNTRALRYAYFDGDTWNIHYTVSSGGSWNSIKLDKLNNPYISHSDYQIPGALLYLSHWNGSNWITEFVDSVDAGIYNSLCLDSNNFPHIAYEYSEYPTSPNDTPDFKLKYARFNSSAWEITTVDSARGEEFAFWNPSLQFDTLGYPNIAYEYFEGGPIPYCTTRLRYAYWDGSTWQIETVDSSYQHTGKTPCLRFDSKGTPNIVYSVYWWIGLAKKSNQGWYIHYIYDLYPDAVIADPKCEIDSNDYLHLTYSVVRYNPYRVKVIYLVLEDTSVLYHDTVPLASCVFKLDKRDLPHLASITPSAVIYVKGYSSSIKDDKPQNLPVKFSLNLVSSNPTIKSIRLKYGIPTSNKIIINLYNSFGSKVATLSDKRLNPGYYEFNWKIPANLPSGTYWLLLNTEKEKKTLKLLLIR